MRNIVRKVWGAALVGLAGLSVTGLVMGEANEAQANGLRRSTHPSATLTPPTPYNPAHASTIRVSDRELGQNKGITLGRNKSVLIELPREMRDVVVSAPEIMDAVVQSSNRVYLIGKKNGQANAFFFDTNGDQMLTLEVVIEHDSGALEALLRRLIPGSNIKAEVLNETVILSGTVRSPVDSNRASDIASRFIVGPNSSQNERHASKVINMIGVDGEEQVMLKVIVAEVQRSLLKQFGINLGADINAGNFVTSLMTSNNLPLSAALGLGGMPIPGFDPKLDDKNLCAGQTCFYNEGPTKSTFGNSGLTGSNQFGKSNISHAIRALERDGLVKTLAEPNLTAVSGESAKFLAGGEYPIPVVDTQGALSVTFKQFGVSVAFTPIVMSEGRISLKIETEVSEISSVGAVQLNGISIPALKKREAKSTVELPSGGSLALAGLLSDDVRQNIDGFPGLKDLPVLGTLFRSRDFVKQQSELVIIVTPYVVRPTARQNLARPDDGLTPATDMKANFLGHLNRVYGKGQPVPDGGLKGNYGFIVE